MILVPFDIEDYSIYETFAIDFYSGGATISTPDVEIFKRNYNHILNNSDVLGYFIKVDDTYAGYLMMSYMFSTEVGGKSLWIEELYVSDHFQGQGIGTQVLQNIVQTNPDVLRFRLEVAPNNKGAYKLYESLGFVSLEYNQMILDK